MRLAGKTAVITGGATGIGQAIATSFAAEGCRVAIAGRREEKLRQAAASYQGEPAILTHVVDVADRASVANLFRWADETLGQVDILVNNAGINTPQRTMSDMLPETWDEVLKINATGAYNCMYAVLPGMRKRQDGLIINIDSISGIRASVLGGVAYCASKTRSRRLAWPWHWKTGPRASALRTFAPAKSTRRCWTGGPRRSAPSIGHGFCNPAILPTPC